MTAWSWNQPQCERCWAVLHTDEMGRIREPVRALTGTGPAEQCAWCGMPTWAGIWVREDPSKVLFPARKADAP